MDALSDVLSTLRVNSMFSSRFEGSGRWALRFPSYKHIKFGCVLSGEFWLGLAGAEPVRIQSGDIYLLTSGNPFFSASDPGARPLDGPENYRRYRNEDGVVRYCGSPDESCPSVSLASGRFTFEHDAADLLLDNLPPLIHLQASESDTSELSLMMSLLRLEVSKDRIGAEVARSSLAALILVNVLRAWIAGTSSPTGWLGALSDTKIGRALTMMHAQPEKKWTLQGLATEVSMSRTAFASHFRRMVGYTPLDYLFRWRLLLAKTALRHSSESLSELAWRIGYQSDTAFSIAFKRATGYSPGQYRQCSRSSPAEDIPAD
ncbi:AraC family transcriptional regulator [Pantoea cypripedii]|uniref:AraC family transcriptional regulator n=1 Tax=Pantoea cypripedii TaxID=55209 RepID=A0A6B9G6Y7_PANCY|nr:AraC family transcriptional regulator [Pantoea cypripedii]QGY32452.1 AraC family transcriptional regulator [Pantoea cypripedii]